MKMIFENYYIINRKPPIISEDNKGLVFIDEINGQKCELKQREEAIIITNHRIVSGHINYIDENGIIVGGEEIDTHLIVCIMKN